MATTTLKTTCPRDCYDGCGIVVTKVDGHIKNIRGDADHETARGRLCRKCSIGYNGVFLDPSARLTTPLRRVGDRFEAISMDAAIALVAERLSSIAAEHGADTIFNTHYTGTLSLLATAFPQRFFNRLGATEVDPDTVCNKAGHVALEYVYGASEIGFDPRTAQAANCIVVWGANPSACAPHQDEYFLGEFDGTVVVVDPIRTETAERADIHLQLRPGTDAAVAFALMHVIERDGLLDREYLQAHTIGFEDLEPLLAECTPEWCEVQSGIPADVLERVAHTYATGPSLLWLGQGLQRQPRGGNIFRACSILPALTGNLGKPGAGFCYMNSGERVGVDYDDLTAAHLAVGAPEPVSQMDLADALEDPSRSRALVCWNINVANSNPQQSRLRAAMRREDLFVVAVDLFPTDTTDLADVVFPAASFLEFDDLIAPYFDIALSAQVKAADPPGEALPNHEIFRRLATAMGFDDPELREADGPILARILERSGLGLSFDELATVGTARPHPAVLEQFADGVFATPSGRIEIASKRAQAAGLPLVPRPDVDEPPPAGMFRLLSPASAWVMNASFGNDPKIAKRLGEPTVTLHPDDAARLDVVTGQRVVLTSDVGRLELLLAVSDRVPRGAALSPKGRWLRQERANANINVLNAGHKTDMGESTAVHGVLVVITGLV